MREQLSKTSNGFYFPVGYYRQKAYTRSIRMVYPRTLSACVLGCRHAHAKNGSHRRRPIAARDRLSRTPVIRSPDARRPREEHAFAWPGLTSISDLTRWNAWLRAGSGCALSATAGRMSACRRLRLSRSLSFSPCRSYCKVRRLSHVALRRERLGQWWLSAGCRSSRMQYTAHAPIPVALPHSRFSLSRSRGDLRVGLAVRVTYNGKKRTEKPTWLVHRKRKNESASMLSLPLSLSLSLSLSSAYEHLSDLPFAQGWEVLTSSDFRLGAVCQDSARSSLVHTHAHTRALTVTNCHNNSYQKCST